MSNLYVRKTAIGDGDGVDWHNAYTELQSALDLIPTGSGLFHNIYIDVDDYTITSMPTINNDTTRILGGYYIDSTLVYSGYTFLPTPNFNTRITIPSGIGSLIVNSGVLEVRGTDITNTGQGPLFVTYNDGTLYVNDSQLNTRVAIESSGYFQFDNVEAYGSGVTYINTYGPFEIHNSKVLGPEYGISTNVNGFVLSQSIVNASNTAILTTAVTSGQFEISDTLIYGGQYSLYGQGTLTHGTINKSTFEASSNAIYFDTSPSGTIVIHDSIMAGTGTGSGVYTESTQDIYAYTTNIYPGPGYVTASGCVYTSPNLTSEGYYLQLSTSDNTAYSPGIDLGGSITSYTSETSADVMGFVFPGRDVNGYEPYLYQKGDNIVFSDLMREVQLAKWMSLYSQPMNFTYNFTKTVKETNLVTRSAFSLVDSDDDWPWEWDYKTLNSPKIDSTSYIIPRSIIDLTDIINNSFGNENYDVDLRNIRVDSFKSLDKRGISFDYNNSSRSRLAVWMLDSDHMLTLRDVYGATDLAKYPLLTPPHPSGAKLFIRPSGLIPYGRTENGYGFIIENQLDIVINGIDEFGNFEWLPTDINKNYDLRGVQAYKNDLFITAVYTTDEEAQPKLIRYPSKGYYEDYHNPYPFMMDLNPANSNPTDITVYEDGSFYINEYNIDSSGMLIYKYKPRYDYAMREVTNEDNVRLILRENYDDVSLIPSGLEI